MSDRIPLQSSLGASAAGLAVCATAREHGLTAPTDWVPLLAKVLLGRDLDPVTVPVPPPETTMDELTTTPDEGQGGTRKAARETNRLINQTSS